MTVGIYTLYWLEHDLFYIGQSSNINNRISTHLRNLTLNKHSNYKVQNSYNQFGPPEFHTLEECSIEELNSREDYWQKEYSSLASLDIVRAGKNHGQGITNPRSKYSKYQILRTFRLCRNPYLTSKQVSNKTGVSLSMVDGIRSGMAHKWLHDLYPFSWSRIESTRELRVRNGYKYSAKKLGRVYAFIDAEGTEYVVDNFSKFASEHGLDASDLSRVASGEYKQTKGFKLSV